MTFLYVIIGLILVDILLLSAKRCPVCGAAMLEYDWKHDYCPNMDDNQHKNANIEKVYEKK